MRRSIWIAAACVPILAAQSGNFRNWTHQDQQSQERSFDVPGAGRKLSVENIHGFIHVTGYDGSQIKVSAQKHYYGRTAEDLQKARQSITLEMTQTGNSVRLYAGGPFRHGDSWNEGSEGYRAAFDYEIQVPRDTELSLHGLNDPILVKQTSGNFQVHGLNGGIDMEAVSGSGSVHTLNGKVKVAFARNPEHNTDFHTLNGPIDVYFAQPLNADLQYHTLNGGVFADFDVASGRRGSARVGSGGPELTFHALNGQIRLHTKTQ
jgi:hypothetical protein